MYAFSAAVAWYAVLFRGSTLGLGRMCVARYRSRGSQTSTIDKLADLEDLCGKQRVTVQRAKAAAHPVGGSAICGGSDMVLGVAKEACTHLRVGAEVPTHARTFIQLTVIACFAAVVM